MLRGETKHQVVSLLSPPGALYQNEESRLQLASAALGHRAGTVRRVGSAVLVFFVNIKALAPVGQALCGASWGDTALVLEIESLAEAVVLVGSFPVRSQGLELGGKTVEC